MSNQFEIWRNQLNSMTERAEEACAGLTEEQQNWKPGKDRWSIAQCLDHLNRANGKILTQLEPAIQGAKASGKAPSGPWKPGMIERLFIRMVGPNPPMGMKSPVPPDFIPDDRASCAVIIPVFRELHERFVTCLDEVEESELIHVRVPSPVTKLVKVSLGTWFEATVEHDLYHLGQAATARQELDTFVAASA